MTVAPSRAEEQEDHQDDQADGQQQRELHVVHGGADRGRAVVQDVDAAGRRRSSARRSCGSIALTRSTTATVLAPGWRWTASTIARCAVVPAGRLVVLDRIDHPREVAQPHRPAVARGDDDVAEAGRIGELRLRLDGQLLARPLDGADRRVGVGGRDRGLDLVDADAARRQRVRIELDAHGIFLAAEDLHLADAVDGRQGRRDHLLGERVELGQRRDLAAAAPGSGSARPPG